MLYSPALTVYLRVLAALTAAGGILATIVLWPTAPSARALAEASYNDAMRSAEIALDGSSLRSPSALWQPGAADYLLAGVPAVAALSWAVALWILAMVVDHVRSTPTRLDGRNVLG